MVDHIIESIKIGSSKQKYGLVHNLNNLGFTSLTTFIDSIMNMFRHCMNLIKICTTSNMGKRKGGLKINSRSPKKNEVVLNNFVLC
jgi:hypothetical protein